MPLCSEKQPVIIALVGKGGVGKTSLSALIVRMLSEAYPDKRILAIDADPAIGLATSLGVSVCSTVDDIRKVFVESADKGNAAAAIEMLGEARYHITDALTEYKNISFLAIGRPEAAGCYCAVNGYLKAMIQELADNFDYIVIDGEAGIEQVNRRVMERVTHLLLISDASKKGIQVAKTIHDVAGELVMFDESGLILNRLPDASDPAVSGLIPQLDTGTLPILTCIPDDHAITISDMLGSSVFTLNNDSPICRGVLEVLEKLDIIEKRQPG